MSCALSFSASPKATWAALFELSDPSTATRMFLNNGVESEAACSLVRFMVLVSIRTLHPNSPSGRLNLSLMLFARILEPSSYCQIGVYRGNLRKRSLPHML